MFKDNVFFRHYRFCNSHWPVYKLNIAIKTKIVLGEKRSPRFFRVNKILCIPKNSHRSKNCTQYVSISCHSRKKLIWILSSRHKNVDGCIMGCMNCILWINKKKTTQVVRNLNKELRSRDVIARHGQGERKDACTCGFLKFHIWKFKVLFYFNLNAKIKQLNM